MRLIAPLALLLLAGIVLAQDSPKHLPAKDRPLQARINEAIDRGVAWLRKTQAKDGSFTVPSFGAAGPTGLALFTLAASGVRAQDEAVKRAADFLASLPVKKGSALTLGTSRPAIRMTYTHAFVVLGLCRADPKTYEKAIRRSVTALVKAQKSSGQWAYIITMNGPLDHGDNSNTQFALLALRAAKLAGFDVRDAVWKRSLVHYKRSIGADGGWGYGCPGSLEGTYGSMTAGGVAALVICRSMLLPEKKRAEFPYLEEKETKRGLLWLSENLAIESHPGIADVRVGGMNARVTGRAFHYYWLYSVERVGMLLSRKYIGATDWYRDGATWLVDAQAEDGSWTNPTGAMMAPEPPLAATCFALLFLKRATLPVSTPTPR